MLGHMFSWNWVAEEIRLAKQQVLLSAESQTPQHVRTTPVLLEPLRRLLGGAESVSLCEMRTRTQKGL